jgi:hypothetical protein
MRRAGRGIEAAVHQALLQFEAQHDVQVVGDLVGVDADGADCDRVDGQIERIAFDSVEPVGEELAVAWFPVAPEGPATGDLVLPDAALRLVGGHACSLAERGADVLGGQPCS